MTAATQTAAGSQTPPGAGRTLRPCGTQAAYERHLRRREPACRACMDAHAAVNRRPGQPPLAATFKPCGTEAAYARHLRRREVPCQACTAAHAARQRRPKNTREAT